MADQSGMIAQVMDWLDQAQVIALGWLLSPAAWSQFALLAGAYIVARGLSGRMVPLIAARLVPLPDRGGWVAASRRFTLRCLPLLLPLVACALIEGGEGVTRSLFGSGATMAFGKPLLFFAVRLLVQKVLTDRFLLVLGRYVLLPVAGLYAVALLNEIALRLGHSVLALGDIRFSVLSLLSGAVAGALLFWLGPWSNGQSATYIKRQDEFGPATKELAVKAAEVAMFGTAVVLLMSIMGIDLTAGAFLGGALGVGVGPGLQQITANFVSGISVSCDTDVHGVPAVIEAAATALPFVLTKPSGPDVTLMAFGDSTVDVTVAFWVSGDDGGKNKYMNPVMFAIWNALRDARIEMPFSQRGVHMKVQNA